MTSVYSHVIFINYIQNNSEIEKGLFSKRRWDDDLGWFNSFYRTFNMSYECGKLFNLPFFRSSMKDLNRGEEK